ncbi:MAG: hypothetical protein WB988_25090 [Candidatus Nitrosopolaris sp.]|jgi:hypothetical protein
MSRLYEIHCYHEDIFQYVVASTNRFPEEKVRKDVEQMNKMLNDELKGKGIRYVFAVAADKYSQNGQKKKQKTIAAL